MESDRLSQFQITTVGVGQLSKAVAKQIFKPAITDERIAFNIDSVAGDRRAERRSRSPSPTLLAEKLFRSGRRDVRRK